MYTVVGSKGAQSSADLETLKQWAKAGSIDPNTVVIDGATGNELRANQLLALQPIFAARLQNAASTASFDISGLHTPATPARPTQPIPSAAPLFAPLPASAQATPKTELRSHNAGRNTAIGCFGLFVVLAFGSCISNMGSQAPPTPAATASSLNIKQGTPLPMTAEQKKLQAESTRQASAAKKAMIAEEKADAARRKVEDAQRRKEERAASVEAERKAREELDKDGLVLLLKSVKAESDEYSTKIHGVIVNHTGRQLSYAQVQFNLYDKSGAQVGTAMDNINNLDDGGRWKFEATTVQDNWNSYKFSDMTGL